MRQKKVMLELTGDIAAIDAVVANAKADATEQDVTIRVASTRISNPQMEAFINGRIVTTLSKLDIDDLLTLSKKYPAWLLRQPGVGYSTLREIIRGLHKAHGLCMKGEPAYQDSLEALDLTEDAYTRLKVKYGSLETLCLQDSLTVAVDLGPATLAELRQAMAGPGLNLARLRPHWTLADLASVELVDIQIAEDIEDLPITELTVARIKAAYKEIPASSTQVSRLVATLKELGIALPAS